MTHSILIGSIVGTGIALANYLYFAKIFPPEKQFEMNRFLATSINMTFGFSMVIISRELHDPIYRLLGVNFDVYDHAEYVIYGLPCVFIWLISIVLFCVLPFNKYRKQRGL